MPSNGSDNGHDDSTAQSKAVSQAEAALKARLGRKRTKTGCLTCRKRRIKCGEERPMCKNCIKSRRHCEGYTQRVSFRPQNFDYPAASPGIPNVPFSNGPASTPFQHGPISPYAYDGNAFSPLQPRPMMGSHAPMPDQHLVTSPVQPTFMQNGQHFAHGYDFHGFVSPSTEQYFDPASTAYAQHQMFMQQSPTSVTHSANGIALALHGQNGIPPQSFLDPALSDTLMLNGAMPSPTGRPDPNQHFAYRTSESSWSGTPYTPRPELTRPIDHFATRNMPLSARSSSPRSETRSMGSSLPEDYIHFARQRSRFDSNQILTEAAVEAQDDDYYDVDSDDSSESEMAFISRDIESRLQIASAANVDAQNNALQARTYHSFLNNGMLDTYRVEQVASPLRNPATARVFMHFLTATGPSLSPFERNPFNPGLIFSKQYVPLSQRGLWNYTMPMAALQNQGLLHAILALSSLHISRLQGGSATPSMQHYAWSLKRIHNAVANRKKRLHITTIAASMLLGFYEIMTADHSKWNTHLAGAKQLFLEIDFGGLMRSFKEMKVARQVRLQQAQASGTAPSPPSEEDHALDQVSDVDERLISQLFGRQVRYGDQGFVDTDTTMIPPRLDLYRLEILKDLFWWYCKQDAYQSLISGNPLLMDYDKWAACPPRAAIGDSGAVYGTFDHLTLLLGRVAAFGSKDRIRKLKQMAKSGGQWVPHPSSEIARHWPAPGVGRSMPGPDFYGMSPVPQTGGRMPASYRSLDGDTSPVMEDREWDLDTALEEWASIQAALDLFRNSLGDAFYPVAQSVMTPFGTALTYRSHNIGCMWAIFHMVSIVAIRSHPWQHPASHLAAAMTAKQTEHSANEIGRISAGIVPGPPGMPLDSSLGSALVESCMPSFFAGIQYTNLEQRHATVTRIYNIARRTGWGTADLIANGCETAWVKTAQSGRGPPYERIVREKMGASSDARLNGSYETMDFSQPADETDQTDRRLVREKAMARLHWAIGIMGTEADI